jgi:hypothetical protein
METWKHGDIDMRPGNMEKWIWRHGHRDMDRETWMWIHKHWEMDMDMETRRHGHKKWTWRNGHGDTDKKTWTWNFKKSMGKRKPRRFSLIRFPFAHRANGSSSFVRLLTKKTTGRLSVR